MRDLSFDTTVLGAASLLALALGDTEGAADYRLALPPDAELPPIGIWRSEDGTVCLDIRPDGTYEGRVEGRRRRPEGTYEVDGKTITLSDTTSGLNTPATLRGDTMEMAGHRLGRSA